ncbi:prepilin peptidase [Candidatus Peregrinibacteria bacterium]|nr:prepilin peptidase [Candidatus Peregrinibacteria bacterium]
MTTFTLILLFITGAAVGSFTSVCIYRIHAGKNGILTGKSECPECDNPLRPLDLIPIASYLALRGKCRFCNKGISYMYPLLEIASGFLFAILFYKFPFIDSALHFSGTYLGLYLLHAFYLFVLLFTFFYDLKYMKISDAVLVPAIMIGLIATIAAPYTPHLIDALIGGSLGFAFFGLQYLVSKGKWIGLGDTRIGAFMGIMLGWKLTVAAITISYMFGGVAAIGIASYKKKLSEIKVPLGPFLVMGTLVTLFFGEAIVAWYSGSLWY